MASNWCFRWVSLALLLTVLPLAAIGEEECLLEHGSFCRCRTHSGNLRLDISSLIPDIINPTPKDPSRYTYTYSPCSDTDCADPSSAVCQYVVSQDRKVGVGRTSNMSWMIRQEKPLTFTILYGDGDQDVNKSARSALVHFQWENSATTAAFEKEDEDTQKYFFTVKGRKVTAVTRRGGGGSKVAAGMIGIVILSLIVVGVVSYLVLGCLYMYRVRGARGVELIPNYVFWREIPHLIWDGCLFTISPCYKRKDGYQSL